MKASAIIAMILVSVTSLLRMGSPPPYGLEQDSADIIRLIIAGMWLFNMLVLCFACRVEWKN
jgi:hypothetical protein